MRPVLALLLTGCAWGCSGGRLTLNPITMNLDCVGTGSSATGSFADGTATAPSIAFTTQNTLGFFKQATNVIGVSQDMSFRLADAAGNTILMTPGSTFRTGQVSDGSFAIELKINSEAFVRAALLSSSLKFGDGAGAMDTGFERAGANAMRVGIGASTDDLEVKILRVVNGVEPTCDSTTRGYVVMVQGGAGVADTFRICTKASDDTFGFRALY